MDISSALEKKLTAAAKHHEEFGVLLEWLGHKNLKKRQAATLRLCKLGRVAVLPLILAAIEPGRPSQHVIAILGAIQKIGGVLVLNERPTLESLLQHSDPGVRQKAEEVIRSMSSSSVPASAKGIEPMRSGNPLVKPPQCPRGRTRPSEIAVAPRGDQALACPKPETPPAPSAGSGLTDQQKATLARVRCKAGIIRNLAFPAAMAASVPVSKEIGAAAFKVFRDGLLRDAGNPSDPVEIMLLEQLTLAHLRVGQLHAQVEITKNIEAVKVYSTAAVRLTGEVRRLALALKQYREPSARKQFTVVRQQNVSAAGQQIAYVAQSNSSPKNSLTQDGELTSKRLDYAPKCESFSKSQTAGSRPPEPAPALQLDTRGAGTVTANRPQEPTMEALDGAEDGGGQEAVGSKRAMEAER